MEAMRLHVWSIEVLTKDGLATARVEATSVRKVRGRPAARIQLEVAVETDGDEPLDDLKARLRDEAIMYLDIA